MDGNCEGNPNPNSLTEDLLIEILLWLPVVSLLRFKAVCKYWRSIIKSSDFIHRHANFEKSTSKLGNFIFQYRPGNIHNRVYKPYFFVLSSSSSSPGSGGGGGEEEDSGQWSLKNLGISPHLSDDYEYNEHLREVKIVGSCHGIICIHDPHLRDVILWNPATKKFRCLPKSLTLIEEFGVLQSEFVLFGFDCETYDYKVLQITFFETDNETDITPPDRIQIYSLRSDSWRWCFDTNLYGHSYKSISENQGRYLNGSYYFSGNKLFRKEIIIDSVLRVCAGSEAVVLSFNFSRECFRMIPAPQENVVLDVIGGDLGKIVCLTLPFNSSSDVCEVYALNDYDYSSSATNADGNEYSWSKLHRFTINHPYSYGGTVAMTKNGVFGFLRDIGGGLVFINFLTEEIKEIETVDASLEGLGDVFRADVYSESLVSIDTVVPSS